MINGKTFYQILGVLDDAEDIVIRAAYKVLAQKYHPDKWIGNKDEENQRMSEINQAYTVLSDSGKRSEYDKTLDEHEYRENSGDTSEFDEATTQDWSRVVTYFPDLEAISRSLRRISRSLENTYKLTLLERKLFNERVQLAKSLERQFLERFFGKDPTIIKFAKFCITEGHQSAAKQLNDAVNLLGSNIPASVVIDKVIDVHFPLLRSKSARLAQDILMSSGDHRTDQITCADFLRSLGATVTASGLFSHTWTVTINGKRHYDMPPDAFITFANKIAREHLAGKF